MVFLSGSFRFFSHAGALLCGSCPLACSHVGHLLHAPERKRGSAAQRRVPGAIPVAHSEIFVRCAGHNTRRGKGG